MITKSKRRRLLLLNDLVVCVSVTPRSTEDFSGNERLTLKWTYPVSDIEVLVHFGFVNTSKSTIIVRIKIDEKKRFIVEKIRKIENAINELVLYIDSGY